MINWKSLGFFILTLMILCGIFTALAWVGYNKGLEFLALRHPEILVTPKDSTVYEIDDNIIKDFREYKKSGYSIMVPKDAVRTEVKGDPRLFISDRNKNWEITINQKLLRYEDTIKSNKVIDNPQGDYYILLNSIFYATKDPILLFQKITFLPPDTTHIKYIRTPSFVGFYIVGQSNSKRSEFYRLFDDKYWHNVSVKLDESKYPHAKIQTMIASLKNDDPPQSQKEEKEGLD